MTKFVCISDTHQLHEHLNMPSGDILLVAGDFTLKGEPYAITDFNKWLGTLDYKHKIVVAGNHDLLFERKPSRARELITNATYLEDSFIEAEGFKIYGSPWQPRFFDWAFNEDRGPSIQKHWDEIPDDVDVLVTHGPPAMILDYTNSKENVGCADLRNTIEYRLKQLKLHVFGHIHESYGTKYSETGLIYVNAASCDRTYRPVHNPIVIELSK